MTSNICKIENGTNDLNAILKESERVADYNGFNKKQTLQLRLLCEEMDGMLPNIIDDFSGDFWIEYEDGVCKVNARIEIPELTIKKKEELIAVSKSKKNALAVGIGGKIRSAIENFFLADKKGNCDNLSNMYGLDAEYGFCLDTSLIWSLRAYKSTVKQEENEETWDELEKSIIASLADDVIVGVKGKQANVVIVKKFK